MMQPQTLRQMNQDEVAGACLPIDDDSCFGSLSTDKGALPLEAMDIRARVVGLVSHIELEQTFVNNLDEAIEATYIFPLPSRAAVGRFRMTVGNRTIEGVIKERGEARQEYNQAIAAGHRAAITEEERPGVFTMRVGNLVPGDKARVTLNLTGPLPLEDGDVTFRFPLVVAPRYIPGNPLPGASVGAGVASDTDQVPDASRISPPVLLAGYPNPVRLRLTLDLDDGGLPISNLRSSLHAVTETTKRGLRRVELRPGERLDRDFICRWSVGDDSVRTSLVMTPDAAGDEGTFALTVVPPVGAAANKPRDVVFVLDRSGSMGGWKMVAARRAVARMVDTLTDADRFNVLAFDHLIDCPSGWNAKELCRASDRNRYHAVEFLAKLEARGGTEMKRPLEQAADAITGGYDDRDRIVVLVTDGQVGNEDHILRALSKRMKNARIFTLGIDRAVNAAFLKRLAAMGGGMSDIVESEDRLDEVMDKVHRRIATPVVTELALEPTGLEVVRDSVVPRRIPDLFAGTPVTITGRYRGTPAATDSPYRGTIAAHLSVRGKTAIGAPWSDKIIGRVGENPGVAKIWARGLVRELEDQYVVSRGDRSELERRIVDTSLRFAVLCRFTAFLAVDDAERVNPGGHNRELTQPVETPDGWASMSSSGPAMGGAPAPGGPPASMPMPMPMAPQAMRPTPVMPRAAESKRGSGAVGAVAGGIAKGVGAILGAPVEAARKMRGRKSKKSAPRPRPPMPPTTFPEQEALLDMEAPAIDLGRYLQRLKQMRDRANEGSTLRTLERLAAELMVLVDDLRSIGAPSSMVGELARVVVELQRVAGEKTGEADALARAIETIDRVLADGARTTEGIESGRREFWK